MLELGTKTHLEDEMCDGPDEARADDAEAADEGQDGIYAHPEEFILQASVRSVRLISNMTSMR